ncbi:MAG: DoxX family protein [Bacteroidetes bacterium]|nr:DoxX family protein [Bacteroidota bacterium]
MGMLHQLEKWSTAHHPRWLVVPRVALGICLIIKGISYLSNSVSLKLVLQESTVPVSGTWLPVIITWLHLLCGFLIIIGLFTRWAALLMTPILLGAVIFVNAPKGIFAGESEFAFSLAVLLMLVFFFIEGGGPLSLDDYFRRNPK